MPMQHLESDPMALAVLKRWFSCFVSNTKALEGVGLGAVHELCYTDAKPFEVLVQLLNCAPSDGLTIQVLIRML